jgi:hypothetical protein
MAKANNNIFVRNLSGSVGKQFVIRKGRGGDTIVSNMPSFSEDRQFDQNQLDHQDTFRHAILYAKTVKNDELYINKAAGTSMTPFNAAVADYFKEPVILEIDASEWQGIAGNEISVQAVDDTLVTKVHVTISDPNGAVLEEGNAQRAGGLWWTYTANTQVPMEPKPHVVVTAYDQPGNTAELAWEN